MKRIAFALLLAATVLPARAYAGSHDAMAAEQLFDEGRQLMKEQRFSEACSKFEASQKLDPGVGTLLNLADCMERTGRNATAWIRFREAASAALSAGQRDREAIARGRALTLESSLVRLEIVPSEAAKAVTGLTIARDGAVLEPDAWGSSVPVDPGAHVVVASAPGKKPWTTSVDIPKGESGAVHTVQVPALEDAPAPPVVGHSQRVAGVVVGSIGLASFATSAGLALGAKSVWSDAEACTRSACDDDARAEGARAGRLADAATGMLITGAVVLAVGVALYFTAPDGSEGTSPARALLGGPIRF